MSEGDGMAEVTEGDRELAMRAVGYHEDWAYEDLEREFSASQKNIVDRVATALAEERERERSQWNPMVGRVIQVAMKWAESGDPKLATCAQQIHAAIGGVQ